MSERSASFVGSIPEFYDRNLGPILFAGYADDLVGRALAASPMRVLETAAGTGIVTRKLRDRLPASARLTASDLNPPMLALAGAKFRPGEAVEFREADASALPFPDDSFDAVVCQFGVMFYPDKDKSYREARRVLSPGGRYLFNVWDSPHYNPFARIAAEVVGAFFPADPPGFYKVPFGYNRIDPVKDALLDAGFAGIDASVVATEREIADLPAFARGVVRGNPLIDQIRERGGVDPERVIAAVEAGLRREFGAGPARMPLQAIVFAAHRP